MAKIILLAKEYLTLKNVLLFTSILSLIPLFIFFKNLFKKTQQEQEQQEYTGIMAVIDEMFTVLTPQGYDFGLTYQIMLDRTNVVANALGTHKDIGITFSEDEELVVQTLNSVYNGDFKIIEYLYRTTYTNNRQLQADLYSYLDENQYNELSHLFTL